METSIRTYLFHTHVHISPCLYMCMFQLDYSVLASCNLYIPIIIRLYVSVPRRLMYTHLWPHVRGSLFQYSYVSILLINTLIPCSYKPIESLDSTPLPNCALFNTVFIRTHSIHINTYSCVHVFTKTVLNKIKRRNVNKWIWNKICIYACLEYTIKLKIYIYIYIFKLYRGPANYRTVMISQYWFNNTKQTHVAISMWYQHKAKYTVIFMSYLQETNHCGEL